MSTTIVGSAAALEAALSSAQSGDTILLAAGTYANVSIQNLTFASAVTVASESASAPAILAGLQVNGDTGLNFSNLDVIGTGQSVYWYANVTNSSNVSFSHMLFSGSDANAQNDA